MEYVLQTEGLTKRYGAFSALDGLTMRVPKGAIYGLVGKNGAGKTTLMRLICGLHTPTSGCFSLCGVGGDSAAAVHVRRRMGVMVESPALYGDMTAVENLKQRRVLMGLPPLDGIDEALQGAGLEGAGRKKVRHFSVGMKQRLALAMTLVGEPDFLVLDEPVNGLDPQGIVEMRGLLRRLNREKGVTILISSHMLDELSRLATHYGIIDRGRMVKELNAEALEAACRKCVRMVVSDGAALARVLEDMGLQYRRISENTADVCGEVPVTRLVLALAGAQCEVLSMRTQAESLESYFLSLVGGGEA